MAAKQADRINEQAMREKFYNRGGAVYRQTGGGAGGFANLLGGAGGNQYAQQRQNAQRAKFAAQSGALRIGVACFSKSCCCWRSRSY